MLPLRTSFITLVSAFEFAGGTLALRAAQGRSNALSAKLEVIDHRTVALHRHCNIGSVQIPKLTWGRKEMLMHFASGQTCQLPQGRHIICRDLLAWATSISILQTRPGPSSKLPFKIKQH